MKTILIIGIIGLILFSGCSSSTMEVKKIEDKLHKDYKNTLWGTCETQSGALVECSHSCLEENYQICTNSRYLDGRYRCSC